MGRRWEGGSMEVRANVWLFINRVLYRCDQAGFARQTYEGKRDNRRKLRCQINTPSPEEKKYNLGNATWSWFFFYFSFYILREPWKVYVSRRIIEEVSLIIKYEERTMVAEKKIAKLVRGFKFTRWKNTFQRDVDVLFLLRASDEGIAWY